MRTLSIAICVGVMVTMLAPIDRAVFAQDGDEPTPAARMSGRAESEIQPPAATMTPELWFHLQEQRKQEDPKLYLREIARQKAHARRARMEAQKWYGISASRPTANPMPMMGTYSPMWAGNNDWNESYWHYWQPTVAIYPNYYTVPR